MNKEDIEAAVWRLQHFINDGVGYDVPKDIRTLLDYVAELEEEIDDLKEAAVPRTVEGDGSDLPFRTVVLDVDKDAWQRTHSGIWEFVGGAYDLRETLSPRWAPYTVIYTPKGES